MTTRKWGYVRIGGHSPGTLSSGTDVVYSYAFENVCLSFRLSQVCWVRGPYPNARTSLMTSVTFFALIVFGWSGADHSHKRSATCFAWSTFAPKTALACASVRSEHGSLCRPAEAGCEKHIAGPKRDPIIAATFSSEFISSISDGLLLIRGAARAHPLARDLQKTSQVRQNIERQRFFFGLGVLLLLQPGNLDTKHGTAFLDVQ